MNNGISHYCPGMGCIICYPQYTISPILKVPHRCPVCEGRGIVRQNFYTMAESSTDAGNIVCRSCVNGIIYV